MNKIITYFSVGTTAFAFVFGFNENISFSTNDLDRINDRFARSASSVGCFITPAETKHCIKNIW